MLPEFPALSATLKEGKAMGGFWLGSQKESGLLAPLIRFVENAKTEKPVNFRNYLSP